MINTFHYLFQYLEKEEIILDKPEFLYQLQSHPDYPSLLSLADTLTFMEVENVAMRLNKEQIELLPNRFITSLHENLSNPTLYFVEKKNSETYWIAKDKKRISIPKSELEQRWANIIFLAEKSETKNGFEKKKRI